MTEWRKSSWSGGVNDNACVEVADLGGRVGLRDSKDPDGPRVVLTVDGFGRLLGRIRGGGAPRGR